MALKNLDETWEKVKKGDMSAFETIYKELFSGLCQYAFQLINDYFLAEETVQDVFLQLWETRHTLYSEELSLKNYLYRITYNQCMDILKKRKTQKGRLVQFTPDDEWTMIAEKYGFDDEMIAHFEVEETMALVEKMVEQLPDQCRTIFRLSRDEGMTNEEIAQQLNLSKSTVRVQLYRATQKLREGLVSLGIIS